MEDGRWISPTDVRMPKNLSMLVTSLSPEELLFIRFVQFDRKVDLLSVRSAPHRILALFSRHRLGRSLENVRDDTRLNFRSPHPASLKQISSLENASNSIWTLDRLTA
eukprot:TRINITY_DN38_c0_g2_i1.p1 TRINITY_DN38_c0_g2~~TRINITY_DN38_c0_g2_i1.p1  ORF type:complete len:108 (+),score=0.93 TRINITY_DN38_c0_g2_i1:497-820(+)